MTLNENQKQVLLSALLSVLIMAAGLVGYGLKPAPAAPQPTFGAQSTSNLSGPLAVDAGSVSAPAYTFNGDTDTGIYHSAANTFDVAAGGSNVLSIGSTGLITAKVLRYGTAGQIIKCDEVSVTGAATVAAPPSTPSYVTANLAQDSTGAIHHVSTTNSAGVVTLKVWTSALTPAASGSAATVDYCIIGTP